MCESDFQNNTFRTSWKNNRNTSWVKNVRSKKITFLMSGFTWTTSFCRLYSGWIWEVQRCILSDLRLHPKTLEEFSVKSVLKCLLFWTNLGHFMMHQNIALHLINLHFKVFLTWSNFFSELTAVDSKRFCYQRLELLINGNYSYDLL